MFIASVSAGMETLKVFCDISLEGAAGKRLLDGIQPHELIFPKKKLASILSEPEPDPAFAEAEIAFGQPDVESIRNSKKLRWLHISTAGFTRYDTTEFRALAAERGLVVTNSSSVFAAPCAEHVLAFMLAQSRKLPESLKSRAANGDAEFLKLREQSASLRGQSAVILGYGAIARELVAFLKPFAMTVTAMRRHPRGDEGLPMVTPDQLEGVLAKADHVLNILPENEASRDFINATLLAKMKLGAIFYNIGRGTTVNQEDLAEALRSGHLGAAWLDVTSPEPLPENHPLRLEKNCFITPHTAGGHRHEWDSLVDHFLKNLKRFSRGEELADIVISSENR